MEKVAKPLLRKFPLILPNPSPVWWKRYSEITLCLQHLAQFFLHSDLCPSRIYWKIQTKQMNQTKNLLSHHIERCLLRIWMLLLNRATRKPEGRFHRPQQVLLRPEADSLPGSRRAASRRHRKVVSLHDMSASLRKGTVAPLLPGTRGKSPLWMTAMV